MRLAPDWKISLLQSGFGDYDASVSRDCIFDNSVFVVDGVAHTKPLSLSIWRLAYLCFNRWFLYDFSDFSEKYKYSECSIG
jgi:hypothetical protein